MRVFLVGVAVIAMSCARSVHPPLGNDAATTPDRDAPASGDPDAPMPPPIDAPAAMPDASTTFACKPANVIHGDGHHNAGQDCMSSCHDHGFSLAGTLYLADGVTPASNATVTVVDANNFSQDIVASTNGNFFSYLPVAYPVTIYASMCPTVQVMVTHPTTGGCNSTACHGGVQGFAHL